MTISFKVSEETKEKLNDFYQDLKREKTPAYAVFQAQDGDTVVTLYESGKIVFQGKDADLASDFWIATEKMVNQKLDVKNSEKKDKKEEKTEPKVFYATTIGSDEVGTGDYFGPIVVTGAYVKKEDVSFLKELGVTDSKKLTDDKILKIVHNKVLINLTNQYNNTDYVVVDQFAKPAVYFNYLKETSSIYRNITFMTKAETKCMSVACASLISRYIFLKEFDKISKSINIDLPKGASNLVDEVGVEIVKKYGFEKLTEIAKLNFKNTEKIKEIIAK